MKTRLFFTLLSMAFMLTGHAQLTIQYVEDGVALFDSQTKERVTESTFSSMNFDYNKKYVFAKAKSGLWAVIDGKTGEQLTEAEFSFINGVDASGLIYVGKNGLIGTIDCYGQIVNPIVYSEFSWSHKGLMQVKKNGQKGWVDFEDNFYTTRPADFTDPDKIVYKAKRKTNKKTIKKQEGKTAKADAQDKKGSQKPVLSTEQAKKNKEENIASLPDLEPISNQGDKAQGAESEGYSIEKIIPEYNHPFITDSTHYKQVKNLTQTTVSDVHEGIFTILEDKKFSFWRTDGQLLFGNNWAWPGDGWGYELHPRFSSGVAAVKSVKPNQHGQIYCALLYKDGRIKELDYSWKEVSQFEDGVAVVKQQEPKTAKISYFYINLNGDKIYPDLSIDGGQRDAARPLRNNRRAFPAADNGKWGFIDKNGKIVIPAQFDCARNFHNGYAWVSKDGKLTLINTTGKEVFKTDINAGKYYHILQTKDVSDVSDKRFYVKKSESGISHIFYYDLNGQLVNKFKSGSPFHSGRAIVYQEKTNDMFEPYIFSIDTLGQKAKDISTEVLNAWQLEAGIDFEPFGAATYSDHGGTVILPDGTIVLQGWESENSRDRFKGIQQFAESGWARMTDIIIKEKRYSGLVLPSGEIRWLFSKDTPDIGIRKDSIIDTFTVEIPTYAVNLKIIGKGDAKVLPGSSFKYGEKATITATPADNWVLRRISYNLKNGDSFAVTMNTEIIVEFVERETIDAPTVKTALQGIRNYEIIKGCTIDIPIYAEISKDKDIKSPYGDNTYGYLAVMLNPEERLSGDEAEINAYALPLKIIGFQRDTTTGKQYLVADGGSVTMSNIKITTNKGLGALFSNLLMQFNDFTEFSTIHRRYRIEMNDINATTGECTLGELEAYSLSAGWVPGQDKSLIKTTKGFQAKMHDKGFPADLFSGVRLKIVKPRTDVLWYTPLSWSKDAAAHENIIKQMGEIYRTYVTDYQVVYGGE